ncbi:DUF45 domain-containing protein [bacterium]|nr:DUF45 domain-containing protein [bacterium]
MPHKKYLAGYPAQTLQQVKTVIDNGTLGNILRQKYPAPHQVRTNKQLYDYVLDIKNHYMSKSSPLNRVIYDNKIQVINHALGQHHYITRMHGKKAKAINEIKIASVFKSTTEAFLKMIAVHELAHFKEKEHNKAFYNLCCHMEPNYHQYEFDTRLYLIYMDSFGELYE